MTFGNRLADVLLSQGISRADHPKELCALAGISSETAKRWLAMEEATMPAHLLGRIVPFVKVRMHWLITGIGAPQLFATLSNDDREALLILDAMRPEQRKIWLRQGHRLARK